MRLIKLTLIILFMCIYITIETSANDDALLVINMENVDAIQEVARIGDGWLNDVSWSPSGDYIAAAGSLGVWVIDAYDLTLEPRLFDGHAGIVLDAIFDPTGKVIASAGNDNRIVLWNVLDGNMLHVFEGQNALTFNHEGSILAFQDVSTENDVVLYAVESGERLGLLPGNILTELTSLRFSSDERMLLGVYRSYRWPYANVVKAWDLETFSTVFETPIGEFATNYAEFSTDMRAILTYDNDGQVRQWDIESGDLLSETRYSTIREDDQLVMETLRQYRDGEVDYLRPYSFSPDHKLFATLTNQLEIWNIETGLVQRSQSTFLDPIRETSIDETDNLLAFLSGDRVLIWSLAIPDHPNYINTIRLENGTYSEIQFSENGGLLVHDTVAHRLSYISDPQQNSDVLWTYRLDSEHYSSVTLLPGKVLVVTVKPESSEYIFEELSIETGMLFDRTISMPFASWYGTPDSNLYDVAVFPQLDLIATAGTFTRLWDSNTKQEKAALFDYTEPESIWATSELAFSPDGKWLLTGIREYGDGVIIWDTSIALATYAQVQEDASSNTGSRLLALRHGIDRRVVDFFADVSLLVTGAGGDSTGIIWLTSNWMSIASLEGHRSSITDVTVFQGRVIITGSSDGTIRLWGVPSDG